MSHDPTSGTDRRTFLQAGALATAAALGAAPRVDAQEADAKATVLPRRKLGKTDIEMTMLEMGTGALRDPKVLERLLRLSFASGVRTFDTAKMYGTEPGFKKWFERSPEVRKQIVLVTKDNPKRPKDMLAMLDRRLEALGTDYVDLFFIHGMGDDHPLDEAIDFVKGPEFKETADKIRKSGKAKVIGFSTHHKQRAAIIQAAADGWHRRRDHAPVHPLAGQGFAAEQGARRLPCEGDRPDLDEAGRRPVPRPANLRRPQGGREAGPDARREEAHALTRACCTRSGPTSGSAARASRSRRPTSSARTPTPPAATSRSRPPSSSSSATRPWPSRGPSAPIATADARSPPAPRPSWAT